MKEKGGLIYRLDRSGRCLFFLGVLLATVALSVASVSIEDDHDDVVDDDYHRIRNNDVDLAFDRPLAAGVPASRNTRFVSSAEEPDSVTETHNAVAAREILENMDLTVDPCDDFYKFSCGNWERSHTIPESKPRYARFDELRDKLVEQLTGLLQKPYNNATESSYIRKAKDLYQSCMDEDMLNKYGAEPLMSLVRQLGTWPLTSPDTFNSFIDLESLLGNLSLMEIYPLIAIRVDMDDRNSSQYITYIDEGSFNLYRKNMLTGRCSKTIMAYEELKRQQAVHVLGLTLSNDLIRDISDVMDFEIKLAEMSATPEERRNMDAIYKKLTVSELRTLFPKFDWVKFLSIYFDAANITVTGDMEVVLFAEDYIRDMFQLYETTDKRIVANYILSQIVYRYASYLSKNIRDLKIPMLKVLYGQTQAMDRHETCVYELKDYMPEAMGQLYVSTYFPASSKSNVLEMIGYIKQSLKQMISDVQWMDGSTKTKAMEKIDAIFPKIGYPDYLFNDTLMEELYKNVDYHPTTYFQNSLDAARWNTLTNAKKLLRTPSRTDWRVSAAVVNAYYSPSLNQIIFPAGILQPPYYGEYLPMSTRFGAIGMVIGHEITHGFDDQGRKYDKDGNSRLWWSNDSIDNYEELVSCYVDQYSKQEVLPGVHVKGKLGLGENIADNGGIKAAFLAFQQWQSDNGKQPGLDLGPGLNLSHEQLFFVSYAQCWCNLMRDEFIRSYAGRHSPPTVRVRVVASNSEHFAKAFNCSVGSNMNPCMKCVLW